MEGKAPPPPLTHSFAIFVNTTEKLLGMTVKQSPDLASIF